MKKFILSTLVVLTVVTSSNAGWFTDDHQHEQQLEQQVQQEQHTNSGLGIAVIALGMTPGNIVYYTVLHLKSGRRSYSAGRVDVLGSGTQLDHKSMVLSFEEPAGVDPETGEEVGLGEMLAGHHEDPASAAGRNVDWELFLANHNPKYGALLQNLGEGRSVKETGCSYDASRKLKKQLALDLLEYMGSEVIADSLHVPSWRGNIMADHEKAACRADRRRH